MRFELIPIKFKTFQTNQFQTNQFNFGRKKLLHFPFQLKAHYIPVSFENYILMDQQFLYEFMDKSSFLSVCK